MVIYIPVVYEVPLPEEYYVWMRAFTFVFDFVEWDALVVPGACLPGGYAGRLTLKALLPIAVMLAFLPLNILRVYLVHLVRRNKDKRPSIGRAVLDTLPFMLFVLFCVVASVSSGLFAAWSCATFETARRVDPLNGNTLVAGIPPHHSGIERRAFLNNDLSIECTPGAWNEMGIDVPHTDEYSNLLQLSFVYIALWPIAVPIIYLAVLLPSRYAILQNRKTRLVRATEFLHREYEPAYYCQHAGSNPRLLKASSEC